MMKAKTGFKIYQNLLQYWFTLWMTFYNIRVVFVMYFLNKFGLLALFGKNAGQKKGHRSDTTAPQKEILATKNILPVLVHF